MKRLYVWREGESALRVLVFKLSELPKKIQPALRMIGVELFIGIS